MRVLWKQKDVDMEIENGAVSVILAKARIVHGVSLFTACKPSSFLIKTLTVCVSGGSNIFQDCPSVIFMLLVFFFSSFFASRAHHYPSCLNDIWHHVAANLKNIFIHHIVPASLD